MNHVVRLGLVFVFVVGQLMISMLPTTVGARIIQPVMPEATCPAALPVGQIFDCSLTTTGEIDSYTLNVTQNDTWYFLIERTAGAMRPYIRLLDANNNEVCSTYTYNERVGMTCTITTTGAYTLKVRELANNSTLTGTYIGYAQRLNTPANSAPITFGTQTDGSLQYGIEDDIFRFDALINDKINIRVFRSVGSMQPAMYVYDAQGNQLCGSYTYNNYVALDCTTTKTGTYYIIVGELNDEGTGSYTLHIQRRNNPGNAETVTYGVPLKRAVSKEMEMDTFTFTAAANDKVFMRSIQTSGALQPSLYVYDSAGDSVCGSYTYNALVRFDCDIPADGTYTAIMQDLSIVKVGEYTLYLQRRNNPGNATAIGFGQTLNGAIEEVAAVDTVTFVPKSNDTINVTLKRTSGSMNAWVGIYNNVGDEVCSSYTYNTDVTIKNCAITITGQHTIFVTDLGDDAAGNYTLALACASATCGVPPPPPVLTPRIFLPVALR
jgi:hypothetical protein